MLHMRTILLSDLVDDFEQSLRSNSYSKATVKTYVRTARGLLAHVGNIQARNVTPAHIDSYFANRHRGGIAASSSNTELASLRALYRHASHRRVVSPGGDPTAHRRPARVVRVDRLRIPASQFPRLLDCAAHPQDRMVVALGLYLFLRRSEIQLLRVGDVDLQLGDIAVSVPKTAEWDRMPISAELDRELRRWLAYYAEALGRPLRPDDYLVPSRKRVPYARGLTREENARRVANAALFRPDRPVSTPERCVQRTLLKFGYEVRDDCGRPLREGNHTLRRSGARALFDRLVSEGYDYAIRTIQAMLHHKSIRTTELYLGLELDKKKRDEIVRGNEMFPVEKANVVEMEVYREVQENRGRV